MAANVPRLMRQLLDLDRDIAATEEKLNRMKARRHLLATTDLPEAMTELGSSKMTTDDGLLSCTVSHKLYGSLPSRDKPDERYAAIEYLRSLDADELIKAKLLVEFGRGNIREANKLKRRLHNMVQEPMSVDVDVNHMTLQAWARSRIKDNKPLNMEILGLRGMTMAEVKELRP